MPCPQLGATAVRGLFLVISICIPAWGMAAAPRQQIAVQDSIGFAELGDPNVLSFAELDRTVKVSPDGKKAAVVVERGNVERGTNEAFLLLVRLDDIEKARTPEVVATMSSAGANRPMALVRWLPDNEHLAFAGMSNTAPAQVYLVNVQEKTLQRLTNDSGELLSFDVDRVAKRVLTLRYKDATTAHPERNSPGYVVLPRQFGLMEEVIRNPFLPGLFASNIETGVSEAIKSEADLSDIMFVGDRFQAGALSPDGRWALRTGTVGKWPSWWLDYVAAPALTESLRGDGSAHASPWASHAASWIIVDLERNVSRILIDGPIVPGFRSTPPVWIDNGSAVILIGVLESLEGVAGSVREERSTEVAVLLVEPTTGRTRKIAALDSEVRGAQAASWDPDSQTLTIAAIGKKSGSLPPVVVRRIHGNWVQGGQVPPARGRPPIEVNIEQSLNAPPILVATEISTGERKVIFDPNPWLSKRNLGKVEHIEWVARDGREWDGGLYFPPDYIPGKRYPLVIQSYVYDQRKFTLHGGVKNHAARPLTATGIFVLSLRRAAFDQSERVDEDASASFGFEAAIDMLDMRGLIERSKVGVVGYSWSGPPVAFLLAFSSYPIKAAAFTDSAFGSGWYYYVLYGYGRHTGIERKLGSTPFGSGLGAWLERSPSFHLDRVQAPVLLTQHSSPPIVYADAWTGLKRLNKPVELWAFPKGTHDLYPVKERLLGNQLYVDWFVFWLKGEERTEVVPWGGETKESLAAQYARWRELRKLHEADLKKPRPPRLKWTATPVEEPTSSPKN